MWSRVINGGVFQMVPTFLDSKLKDYKLSNGTHKPEKKNLSCSELPPTS